MIRALAPPAPGGEEAEAVIDGLRRAGFRVTSAGLVAGPVTDGRIVASRGPGTAFEFALALVRLAASGAQAESAAAGLAL